MYNETKNMFHVNDLANYRHKKSSEETVNEIIAKKND
jgi:hypothetical protein